MPEEVHRSYRQILVVDTSPDSPFSAFLTQVYFQFHLSSKCFLMLVIFFPSPLTCFFLWSYRHTCALGGLPRWTIGVCWWLCGMRFPICFHVCVKVVPLYPLSVCWLLLFHRGFGPPLWAMDSYRRDEKHVVLLLAMSFVSLFDLVIFSKTVDHSRLGISTVFFHFPPCLSS